MSRTDQSAFPANSGGSHLSTAATLSTHRISVSVPVQEAPETKTADTDESIIIILGYFSG